MKRILSFMGIALIVSYLQGCASGATVAGMTSVKTFLITYKIPPRLTIGTILYLGIFKMMENGHVKESNTVPKGLQFNGVIPRLRHGRTMHESII